MVHIKKSKTVPQQYGFRQDRNTTDQIATLKTDILNDFKKRKATTSVFFDLEKGFNTISRRTIVNNPSDMGVTGRMLKFIQNYLNKRTVKVKIGNTLSKS